MTPAPQQAPEFNDRLDRLLIDLLESGNLSHAEEVSVSDFRKDFLFRPHPAPLQGCPQWKNNQCNFDGTDCPSVGCKKARQAREEVLKELTVAVADMGFPMIEKTNEFDDGRACAYGYFMREIAKLRSTQHPGQ